MTTKKLDWTPDLSLPAGKGATVQRFTATDGDDQLEIDTMPWGEGDLTINDKPIAHVADELSGGDAFRDLEAIAEKIEDGKTAAAGRADSGRKAGQT